jgi:hypothetical protein
VNKITRPIARLLEDARIQAKMARDKYGEAHPTPLDDAFMSLVRAVDALNAAVALLTKEEGK